VISLVTGLWNINRPLAMRVTTEVQIPAKDLIKPRIEKEEGNQSKLLLIDSLEQSLPLILDQAEQKTLLHETLYILLIECAEQDCQVIYHAQQLLQKWLMSPLEPGGLIYRLLDLEHAAQRQQRFLKDPDHCFEWIKIKGGTFWMGDDEHNEDEKPSHQVKVSSFFMTKHPVTNHLLSSFPLGGKHPEYGDDRHPAVGNTWWEAYYFALWIHARLPTEAEWEYAARGGKHTERAQYYFGDSTDELKDHAWFGESERQYAHAVDELNPRNGKENLNQFGLANILGNVWEWCTDWYDGKYYDECKKKGIVENPEGSETGSYRVLRGGGWNIFAQYCRSAYRNYFIPGRRYAVSASALCSSRSQLAARLTLPVSYELFERNKRGAKGRSARRMA
jgi:formylglycine-generating enzyme required for sulfatase activity